MMMMIVVVVVVVVLMFLLNDDVDVVAVRVVVVGYCFDWRMMIVMSYCRIGRWAVTFD
jgi:nucleoside permease NupC